MAKTCWKCGCVTQDCATSCPECDADLGAGAGSMHPPAPHSAQAFLQASAQTAAAARPPRRRRCRAVGGAALAAAAVLFCLLLCAIVKRR